jgi:transcriptional regulator with XRE-family HTH domain
MGVQAIAGYIQGLIDRKGLIATKVAEGAEVQLNYLWRLEQGLIKEPSATKLASLVEEVGGDHIVAMRLLLDPNATSEDGRALASVHEDSSIDPKALENLLYHEFIKSSRDPKLLAEVFADLWEQSEEDPKLIRMIKAMLVSRRPNRDEFDP